jgi:hypothetical protein
LVLHASPFWWSQGAIPRSSMHCIPAASSHVHTIIRNPGLAGERSIDPRRSQRSFRHEQCRRTRGPGRQCRTARRPSSTSSSPSSSLPSASSSSTAARYVRAPPHRRRVVVVTLDLYHYHPYICAFRHWKYIYVPFRMVDLIWSVICVVFAPAWVLDLSPAIIFRIPARNHIRRLRDIKRVESLHTSIIHALDSPIRSPTGELKGST